MSSAEPYSSAGTITLQITLIGSNYEIGTAATTYLTLHDVFDFDCFTTGWMAGFSDSSQSAAMIQTDSARQAASPMQVKLVLLGQKLMVS